jgi:uncharacterized repeat protein (TIGR01451 family)
MASNGILPNANQSFTLTVNAAAPAGTAPVITSANSATFSVGVPGSFTVTATGNPAPALSETGALPPGLTFNPATGVLSGTPGPTAQGTFSITFTAANGVLPNANQAFTITVLCNPTTKGCIGNVPVTVVAPSLSKRFLFLGKGLPTMTVGNTIGLQFSINNPNASTLTGVGFTDNLPAGLQVAGSGASTCGGTVTAAAGTISLTGGTVAPNSTCGFTVTILATSAGPKANVTQPVVSNEGGTGNAASDSITVVN